MSPTLSKQCVGSLTPSLPNLAKSKFWPNFHILFCEILKNKYPVAPCVSKGRQLSFEWSHHRIWSADSKVRVTIQNSIKHSGNERVNVSQSKNNIIDYVQGLWTGACILSSLSDRLESLTICRCHYIGSSFSSITFKTLSVGLAKVWTKTLLLSRPALIQSS